MATDNSIKRTRAGSIQNKSTHRKSGGVDASTVRLRGNAARRSDIDPRRHSEMRALEALIERERARLMTVEALLGAAQIVLDNGEDDNQAPYVPNLLDLAYTFTKASIHALDSVNRLETMSATMKDADDAEDSQPIS